jgi:hypothetical protein
MYNIKAFKTQPELANLEPLIANRDWMDNTWEAHAYHCFPVSLANKLGWSISYPEDIVFIWDGINDSEPSHVKILHGEKYAYSGRANGTISFKTGIKFETEDNLTMIHMPVPNYFRDGWTPFTTLISTSWYSGELPSAAMITRPNQEITIKAGTPVAAILPINLSDLQNSEINFLKLSEMKKSNVDMNEYSNAIYEENRLGKWTDYYRNATDHNGNKIGEHQVKTIKLKVNENV